MNTEEFLTVTEIQRFCMHDGPGIRTTVFLKGCPLRCVWCHNPEAQKKQKELLFYDSKCIFCKLCEQCARNVHTFGDQHEIDRKCCILCESCTEVCPTGALEICGRKYKIEDLLSIIERDIAFYGKSGGMTLSGGEPLMQGEAVISLLKMCKEKCISTSIETCGFVDYSYIEEAIPYTDLFLWDIKDTDDERHKRYTGVSNETILDNLKAADEAGAKIRLRCILVNGVNAQEEHYREVGSIALSLKNCEGVEWIPYHAYGGTKAVFLGASDSGNRSWIPSEEQLSSAKRILRQMNIMVF